MTNPNVLTVSNVRKSYPSATGETLILAGVSLMAQPGETIAITGPSGAGKSTLLHIIGSLDTPSSGSVRLGETEIGALSGRALETFRARRLGFVFQDHHLLPQLTALENVLLPTLAAGTKGMEGEAEALLARVGVAERAGAFPAQMSGGERQRVALARALINGPCLLLCDEPTGNLDQESGDAIISLLLQTAAERGVTVLLVTHNPLHAARCARGLALRKGLFGGATVTVARLIARSLCYYWRTGLVVLLGIAVAAAVITGSLLVGDSVTGSLRDTALARLGAIDHALVSPTPFPADLADRLAHDPALSARLRVVAPLLLATGAAQSAASSITIPNVSVIGIDSSFQSCFPHANFPALSERQVALNAALARDLQVGTGDFLLLTVARQSVIPADTLFASRKRAEATRTLRLQVAAVLPDAGVGGFTLGAGSATPRNLFISRAWLNAQTGKGEQANVLAVVARAGEDHTLDNALAAALSAQCTLADYGLTLTPHPAQGYLALRSDAMLLNARQVQAARNGRAGVRRAGAAKLGKPGDHHHRGGQRAAERLRLAAGRRSGDGAGGCAR